MIYWTVTGTSVENMEVKQCTALLTPPIEDPSFGASWQATVVGRHNGRMAGGKKIEKKKKTRKKQGGKKVGVVGQSDVSPT